MQQINKKYRLINLFLIGLFGLINGMAILFSGNTINYWLASNNVNIEIIGLFSLIIIPHAFKYLIAIFINYKPIFFLRNYFGHLKTWLILSQFSIVTILFIFTHLEPKNNLFLIAILGFILSLMAVIQYVILNGKRIDLLDNNNQGKGSAIYNIGYRLGMFVTGAGVIYLSSFLNWKKIYFFLLFGYLIFSMIVVSCYKESENFKPEPWKKSNDTFLSSIFRTPIKYFNNSKDFFFLFVFVLFYQFSDTMLMSMLNPFLLHKSYTPEEIAGASKVCGLVMVIIGSFVGGIIVDKTPIRPTLMVLGLIHSVSYISFYNLALQEKNLIELYIATGFGAFTGGMATTAYLSYVTNLSKGKHAAVIYAFLSSIIGLAWALFPCFSGLIVENTSWNFFFIFIFFCSIITSTFSLYSPKSNS